MKSMTPEELAAGNGHDGKPHYVAFQGKIYDLSASAKWKNGKHMARHEAGRDLTAALAGAPHDASVLDRFPAIGLLADDPQRQEERIHAPWPLAVLYEKAPFVKRHAHPFAVHFPIGLLLAGFLFLLLHLLFGVASYATTSFHLLVLGTITAPFAVLSGMQTWWLYYGLSKAFKLRFKLYGGIAACFLAIAATILFALVGPSGGTIALYAALVLLVGAVGYVGGQLTFPND